MLERHVTITNDDGDDDDNANDDGYDDDTDRRARDQQTWIA